MVLAEARAEWRCRRGLCTCVDENVGDGRNERGGAGQNDASRAHVEPLIRRPMVDGSVCCQRSASEEPRKLRQCSHNG